MDFHLLNIQNSPQAKDFIDRVKGNSHSIVEDKKIIRKNKKGRSIFEKIYSVF